MGKFVPADTRAGTAAASTCPSTSFREPPNLSNNPMICLLSGVLFVLRGSEPRRCSVLFAHVRAALRGPVVLVSGEVIDLGVYVYPHDGIGRTASLRLIFG